MIRPSMILQADGTPFTPPEILSPEEVLVIQKTFGMTARNDWKPIRKEFRWGVLPADSPTSLRLNEMQRRGLLRLIIDGKQLSRKDFARFKAGDYSRAALVSQVTKKGVEAYIATLKEFQDRKARERKIVESAQGAA